MVSSKTVLFIWITDKQQVNGASIVNNGDYVFEYRELLPGHL